MDVARNDSPIIELLELPIEFAPLSALGLERDRCCVLRTHPATLLRSHKALSAGKYPRLPPLFPWRLPRQRAGGGRKAQCCQDRDEPGSGVTDLARHAYTEGARPRLAHPLAKIIDVKLN